MKMPFQMTFVCLNICSVDNDILVLMEFTHLYICSLDIQVLMAFTYLYICSMNIPVLMAFAMDLKDGRSDGLTL